MLQLDPSPDRGLPLPQPPRKDLQGDSLGKREQPRRPKNREIPTPNPLGGIRLTNREHALRAQPDIHTAHHDGGDAPISVSP